MTPPITELRVGVIDSGFPARLQADCRGRNFAGGNTLCDLTGHGSAIVQPLHTLAGIRLYNARIFDTRLVCHTGAVVAALNWLIDEGVDLINMSFGLAVPNADLTRACDRARKANIVLVAAAPAQGAPVYPASHPATIRATGDARCQPEAFSWLNSPQADLGGHPGNPRHGPAGASVGCAHVSAVIARHLIQHPHTPRDPEALLMSLVPLARYQGREYRRTQEVL